MRSNHGAKYFDSPQSTNTGKVIFTSTGLAESFRQFQARNGLKNRRLFQGVCSKSRDATTTAGNESMVNTERQRKIILKVKKLGEETQMTIKLYSIYVKYTLRLLIAAVNSNGLAQDADDGYIDTGPRQQNKCAHPLSKIIWPNSKPEFLFGKLFRYQCNWGNFSINLFAISIQCFNWVLIQYNIDFPSFNLS